MRNKIMVSLAVLLMVISVGMFSGMLFTRQGEPLALATDLDRTSGESTLVVSGLGRVNIKPDIAYINAGVETIMKDARQAQEENAKAMNRVMAALRAQGVQDKDMQTSHYSVSIEYDYSGEKRTKLGYRVANNIRVSIRQVQRVGEMLTALHKAGANNIHGVTFGVENQADAYATALEEAIKQAKAEAGIMAKHAGVTLGKPIAVYEGQAPQEIFSGRKDLAIAEQAGSTVPIMEGEFEVQATVTIVYGIE